MRDHSFQTCNQVFISILHDFREGGVDITQHKEALTAGDVKCAYSFATWATTLQFFSNLKSNLTHRVWVTHICVSNLTNIGSDDGLSPGWHQAIMLEYC